MNKENTIQPTSPTEENRDTTATAASTIPTMNSTSALTEEDEDVSNANGNANKDNEDSQQPTSPTNIHSDHTTTADMNNPPTNSQASSPSATSTQKMDNTHPYDRETEDGTSSRPTTPAATSRRRYSTMGEMPNTKIQLHVVFYLIVMLCY